MAELQQSNSFSWGDAVFLYIERPGQPLNIACVMIFEGAVSLKACRDFVESKLPLIPRYRQHVVFPPFNLGLPSWEFDPNFDIRNHIRQVTLRNGTEAQLKTIASELVSQSLDRQRPLWDFTLVRGLEGGRTGMVVRIHHCLADGMAGVGILNVLMDPSPIPPVIPRKKPVYEQPPARDGGAAFLDTLMKSCLSAVGGAITLQSEALNIAQEALANPTGPLADLMNVMPELASPSERLPFNIVCQGPQKFAWTEIAMADIQSIRQHCGGTLNDVILTVVAAAVRRYAEACGVHVKGRSARIMIPVNVRGRNSANQLGNHISFLPVTIPLDIRDPQKLFRFVRERMEYLKRARAAEFVALAGGLCSAIPSPIWAAIGPVASQLPLSLCNIICTNVPGPQVPLHFLGHKMAAWYPCVPIGGEMGLNCAILTYNGTAYFGFTCDVHAVPDPGQVEKFVDASFAELRKTSAKVVPEQVEAKPAETAPSGAPRRQRPQAEIPSTPARSEPKSTAPVTPKRASRKRRSREIPVSPKPAQQRRKAIPSSKAGVSRPKSAIAVETIPQPETEAVVAIGA